MSNDKKQAKPSAEPAIMEKIVSLCKQRGFVFQSSEIYGGLKSCYDYGPLGAELKRNVKAEWWRTMVHGREDVVGLDASIIMHPDVWRASGHAASFTDPMVDCKLCNERFRADKAPLIVESAEWEPCVNSGDLTKKKRIEITASGPAQAKEWLETRLNLKLLFRQEKGRLVGDATLKKGIDFIQIRFADANGSFENSVSVWEQSPNILCPKCGCPFLTEIRRFNMMFRTPMGAVDNIEAIAKAVENVVAKAQANDGVRLSTESLKLAIAEVMDKTTVYLRPETAQAMFVNFLNVQQSMRMKPPFGIAQQGKSFRNEITVEHFTFRSCEFEQMEMEFFVPPPGLADDGKDDMYWYDYWCQQRLKWYINLGINPAKLRLRPHAQDELAHYAKACSDVEYEYPWGWGELEGIAHRGDYDLKQHEKHSGKKLTFFDSQKNAHYHPFVIEPAAGADRTALAFMLDAYTEEPPPPGTTEGRTVLKLHPRLAPIKVAVFPLVKKDGMPEIARKVMAEFHKKQINAFYDEKDTVGRRYRRQDECGTPYCITVDGQTATDGSVTIRERDSMKQERIQIDGAVEAVLARLA